MKKKVFMSGITFFLMTLVIQNVNAATPDWLTSEKVSCGRGLITNIPSKIPEIISTLILVAQIIVPIMLVIFGTIDFVKGIANQKEDEIKKGQQTFIKRLITGIIVFLVVALVKLLVSVVGATTSNQYAIIDCTNCFINNDCGEKAVLPKAIMDEYNVDKTCANFIISSAEAQGMYVDEFIRSISSVSSYCACNLNEQGIRCE